MAVVMVLLLAAALGIGAMAPAAAQTPPSPGEIARYTGLHAAVALGRTTSIVELLANGLDPNARDGNGRTPLHVAAFLSQPEAARLLVAGGADPNALDAQRYDVVTIAAVKNDRAMLRAVLALGASARNVTSPYAGTALIAAAHLGHHEIVGDLVAAGAPLDHVNNLGWTAVIEAIVLGDGGSAHLETLRALVEAGADTAIPDRQGRTPLMLAGARGFTAMMELLQRPARR